MTLSSIKIKLFYPSRLLPLTSYLEFQNQALISLVFSRLARFLPRHLAMDTPRNIGIKRRHQVPGYDIVLLLKDNNSLHFTVAS